MKTMPPTEVKKMKQGMPYSCKEKTIILNVFKYFRSELPDKCITDIVRRTAKATGCSEKSIFQFRKEEASAEGFKEPSKTKVRNYININSRDIKYDENVRQAIKNIIYELKCRSVVPSLNTILRQIGADKSLPKFSLMTLRRLLFDMGFYYEKNGSKFNLVEKSSSITQEPKKQPNPKKLPQNIKKQSQQTTQQNYNVNQPTNYNVNPPNHHQQMHLAPPQPQLMQMPPDNQMPHPEQQLQMMVNVRRDLLPLHHHPMGPHHGMVVQQQPQHPGKHLQWMPQHGSAMMKG